MAEPTVQQIYDRTDQLIEDAADPETVAEVLRWRRLMFDKIGAGYNPMRLKPRPGSKPVCDIISMLLEAKGG